LQTQTRLASVNGEDRDRVKAEMRILVAQIADL